MRGLLNRLAHIDRRYLFVIVALAVAAPIVWPFSQAIAISAPVQRVFDFLEGVPAGSTILMSFDYGPAAYTELDPIAISMLHQCFRRNLRIVTMTLQADGKPYMETDTTRLAAQYGKVYGVDYVNLGYQAGDFAVIQSIGAGFEAAFKKDIHGTPIAEIPLMQHVHGYPDLAAVMDVCAADPGIRDFVKIVVSQYKRPVSGGCTAVYVPEMAPYMESGQLFGLIGGLRGAAEYEKLVGNRGLAAAAMSAQSVVHIVLVAFIILSNAIYLAQRRQAA